MKFRSATKQSNCDSVKVQDAKSCAELRATAIDILSRREHSRQELAQKLALKGGLAADIIQVLEWCEQENYQSDRRFCAMLVRSKIAKGYGPAVVFQSAREHNLAREMLQESIEQLAVDWFELALNQYRKKYSDTVVKDFKEKQKRMGFLQRRGFNTAQIQYAMQLQDS